MSTPQCGSADDQRDYDDKQQRRSDFFHVPILLFWRMESILNLYRQIDIRLTLLIRRT
jgi:hypothetical protein